MCTNRKMRQIGRMIAPILIGFAYCLVPVTASKFAAGVNEVTALFAKDQLALAIIGRRLPG